MPVQFPHNDQVPGLTLAGVQSLGAGIGGGLQQLAEGIAKRQEESKRLNTAGKASKQFLKAIADQAGLDPHAIDAMSAAEAIAQMTGLNAGQHYQKGVLDAQTAAEVIAARREESANLARQPAFFEEANRLSAPQPPSNEAMGAFYEGPGSEMSAESARPRPAPMMSGLPLVAAAAQRSGYRLPASALDDVLRMAAEGNATVAPPVSFPLEGNQIGYGFPGTKVRGVYPDMNKALATEEIELPSGEVVTVLRAPGARAPQTLRSREPKGQVTDVDKFRSLTQRYTALIGKRKYDEAAKVLAELQALGAAEGGGGTATPAEAKLPATPNEPPKPTTKAAYDVLPSGTAYVDPTGVRRVKK